MKKVLIAVALLVAFVGYAIHQKGEEAATITPTTGKSNLPGSSTTLPTSSAPSSSGSSNSNSGSTTYKDGTYTGSAADAFYGNIQVQVAISGGKITNVTFLQAPNDRGQSVMINQQADPILAQEAVQAQSANVDVVSGATQSSMAFQQSLASALAQAK